MKFAAPEFNGLQSSDDATAYYYHQGKKATLQNLQPSIPHDITKLLFFRLRKQKRKENGRNKHPASELKACDERNTNPRIITPFRNLGFWSPDHARPHHAFASRKARISPREKSLKPTIRNSARVLARTLLKTLIEIPVHASARKERGDSPSRSNNNKKIVCR
ncbi:hypothetical protein NPIL_239451 [Nephila pilipes]|uniref:Uncharacterized protein n=1 Tax=Nephila pilipes TaxID=299642 RepID=A0A8X6QUY4_NEPPI|nr:hypothetical protein NPIL_239451 [Nephila pilipes]